MQLTILKQRTINDIEKDTAILITTKNHYKNKQLEFNNLLTELKTVYASLTTITTTYINNIVKEYKKDRLKLLKEKLTKEQLKAFTSELTPRETTKINKLLNNSEYFKTERGLIITVLDNDIVIYKTYKKEYRFKQIEIPEIEPIIQHGFKVTISKALIKRYKEYKPLNITAIKETVKPTATDIKELQQPYSYYFNEVFNSGQLKGVTAYLYPRLEKPIKEETVNKDVVLNELNKELN